LLYLIDSQKSSGTVNIHNSALRFIYGAILVRNINCRLIPRQHPALLQRAASRLEKGTDCKLSFLLFVYPINTSDFSRNGLQEAQYPHIY